MQQCRHIQSRMNGIAGKRMVKLEAEMLARWDSRTYLAQRNARGCIPPQRIAQAGRLCRIG
jgi:hypothetical protein